MKIEVLHDFHDPGYSNEWAEKVEPTTARLELFNTILKQIEKIDQQKYSVLELGIGPEYLAKNEYIEPDLAPFNFSVEYTSYILNH